MSALSKRLRDLAFERGGLIALATLVLYVWLAPPYIVDGDNAEFATLGNIGGVAHPSGYPLYLIWLRAWSWLPAQSPAHTAAIATAFLGAIQVFALHAACRAWGARPTAASFAVAIFASGPVVLRIQTEAEVFALNGLVVAVVLWLAAAGGPLRGRRRAFALGLAAGLGLANHLTCVLVAPIGILGVIRGMREGSRPQAVVLAVAGLALGLTPYLYLMATADTLISWSRIESLRHLVHHFLRSDYGGPGQFSAKGTDVTMVQSLVAMAQTIGRAWLYLPAIAGVAVLVSRIARPKGKETRWGWAMLALAWLVAGPLLVSRFNVAPEGIGLYVVRRFHILPALLLAPAVAIAFDEAGTWLHRRSSSGLLRSRILGEVIASVAFCAFIGLSLPHLLRLHSPAVELGLRNTLRSLPEGAVLISHTDLTDFGMGYLQGARGERTDVTVISWPRIPSLAYRQRLERRTGLSFEAGTKGITTVEVAEQILAMNKPLFIDPFNSNIAKVYPTYPYGILFRVLPRGQQPPPVDQVFALNKAMFEKFDLSYPVPGPDDEYATELHQHYARLWHTLAQGLGLAGRNEDRAIADAFAQALAPHD